MHGDLSTGERGAQRLADLAGLRRVDLQTNCSMRRKEVGYLADELSNERKTTSSAVERHARFCRQTAIVCNLIRAQVGKVGKDKVELICFSCQ